jgi:hypothetical protein
MKHIQKFESYSVSTNEAFRHKFKEFMTTVKMFLWFPVIIPITNFANPRLTLSSIETNLNLYHSLPTLRQALQNLLNDHQNELTDIETEDIEYKIDKINKELIKYPTIDSYKAAAKKVARIANYRNRNFLYNRIDTYQPIILDIYDAVKEIKKINKNIVSNDSEYDVETTRSTVTRTFRQARNQEENNPHQNPREINWANEFDR